MSTNPTTGDYVKYANLQMAAEAFLVDASTEKLKPDLPAALRSATSNARRVIA
jgi:hypothetical protein